jgi:hypothetical protein
VDEVAVETNSLEELKYRVASYRNEPPNIRLTTLGDEAVKIIVL